MSREPALETRRPGGVVAASGSYPGVWGTDRRRCRRAGVAPTPRTCTILTRVTPRSLPIELIAEVVLTAIWEIVLQMAAEVLIELGFGSVAGSLRERSRVHPVWAGSASMLMGALVGVATCVIWPTRILRAGPVPGLSLLLSPLGTGALMEGYGQWREGRGRARSFLATFRGGALFAFAMAFVRFLWVGM